MSSAALPSGSVTFFFSDIEGSTRAATILGDGFAPALEAHRREVRAAFEACNGVEVSTAGNSFFAVFEDPIEAVAAAVAAQRGVAAAGNGASALKARIGLHTGQAVRVGNDYIGLDVHRAARIADAGHGGQILVSDAARTAAEGRLPTELTLVDLGRHRLKDVGPERLWQIDGPGLPPGPFPPPRSLEAHPSNLPRERSPIIGRDRERAALAELVAASPLVTVTGPGGIGKTRLVIDVARMLLPSFPDGAVYLELATIADAAAAASALLDVLEVRVAPDEAPRGALLERLRSRDLLVVLDTGDRVDGLAGLVAAISSACPRIHVLVTSRSPLHAAMEREFQLAPLASEPAVELFSTRARAIRSDFVLDAESLRAVRHLVTRLDGIPLAIELAAARTRLFSPTALLDRLERRLPALGEGSRDGPDRQRTLTDTIAWSCELLAPADQAMFEQLGVFAGSFDLEALEAIVEPFGGADAVTVLDTLVDRSLVVVEPSAAGETQFRLLGPIREFARDALRARGSEASARERHAEHWLAFVSRETPGLDGPEALDVVRRLALVEPDLRQALDWSLANPIPGPDRALELAGRLGPFWRLRGRVAEATGWLARSVAASGDTPTEALARALYWLGVFRDDASQPAEAAQLLERALAVRTELGDELGVARTLNSLGAVARSMGDLDRAERLLRESLDRKEALGDRRGVSMSLSNLGLVAGDRGRTHEAVDLMRRSLEIDEELGGAGITVARTNLSTTLVHAGKIEEGLEQLRRALPGIEELSDPELVIDALRSLAAGELGDGDPRAAARLLFVGEVLRNAERTPLYEADRRHRDELLARVAGLLDAPTLDALRAEAAMFDTASAIALARSVAERKRGA